VQGGERNKQSSLTYRGGTVPGKGGERAATTAEYLWKKECKGTLCHTKEKWLIESKDIAGHTGEGVEPYLIKQVASKKEDGAAVE